MRYLPLLALLLLSACGRSGLGSRRDGAMVDQRPSEQADSADEGQQTVDVSSDRQADQREDSSPCSYKAIEDGAWLCGADYQRVTKMSDSREVCPTYYVFEKTGQTDPLLQALLTDNGCDSSCRWEPSLWKVSDNCGPTVFVVGYHSYEIACQLNNIWYSSTTGRFYLSRAEAEATILICPDAGSAEARTGIP